MMIKILTVLKSGKEFNAKHVYAIQDMCRRHIHEHEFDFYCLTDLHNLNCNTINLEHGWPTWWSKIELFKIKGPVLYFDLDMIITNNIDCIISSVKNYDFIGLHDQWHPEDINSSMMYWKNDMSALYNDFIVNPRQNINKFKGDQDYISSKITDRSYIQDVAPGQVMSYKANLNDGEDFDKYKHNIVFFHGPPRPWEQNIIPYNYEV